MGDLRRRDVAARALAVLAGALAVAALVLGYARHAVLDADQFADRASAALGTPAVRTVVARKVTDEVVRRSNGDLLAARPLIESVAGGVVGSDAFRSLFRAGVADVHRAILRRDRNTVTLTLSDVGVLVGAALERFSPATAREVQRRAPVRLLDDKLAGSTAGAARTADHVRALALIVLIAALLAAGGSIALAPDRRRAVERVSVGLVLAGLVVAVGCVIARAIVLADVGGVDPRAAAGAVWDAFLGDLRNAGLALAGCGAVLVGITRGALPAGDVRLPVRAVAGWLADPGGTRRRQAARAVVLVVLGLALLTARDAVLTAALIVAGVLSLATGVAVLLRLAAPAEPRPARRRRRRRPAVIAAGIVVVTGAAVALFLGGGGVTTAAPSLTGCNGSRALCARPLNEVVFPATHNSMSVPLPGWYSAIQERPIAGQLEDGIRGLLIDTHYGDKLPNGRVRTELGEGKPARTKFDDEVGPQAVKAGLRLRDRLFSGKGKRGLYLCHTFCELGATPLASALGDLRDFLVEHPRQVVIVVNQDAITPQDFVGAVRDAGLASYAYAGPGTGSWPTLGQLIDSGHRLVLFAENRAGAAPWYHLAYDGLMQETPFEFGSVAALTSPSRRDATCRPNRGGRRGDVFLINQWVGTDPAPRPANAAKVNAYGPLLARARACERLRGLVPTLLAVDFYRQGALFRVARTLNREQPPAAER